MTHHLDTYRQNLPSSYQLLRQAARIIAAKLSEMMDDLLLEHGLLSPYGHRRADGSYLPGSGERYTHAYQALERAFALSVAEYNQFASFQAEHPFALWLAGYQHYRSTTTVILYEYAADCAFFAVQMSAHLNDHVRYPIPFYQHVLEQLEICFWLDPRLVEQVALAKYRWLAALPCQEVACIIMSQQDLVAQAILAPLLECPVPPHV
jgi:hypothetical protein